MVNCPVNAKKIMDAELIKDHRYITKNYYYENFLKRHIAVAFSMLRTVCGV